MKRTFRLATGAALLLVFASPALAHPGHSGAGDLASGLLHPWSGIDHLLAICASGALAAALGNRAVWAFPALFAVTMLLGGVLGAHGVWSAHAEYVLALSVPGLLLLLLARRWAGYTCAAVTTAFVGLFHGAAHGAELPAGADPIAYFAGFLLSAIMLLGMGVALFQALRVGPRRSSRQLVGGRLDAD